MALVLAQLRKFRTNGLKPQSKISVPVELEIILGRKDVLDI